MEIFTVTFFFLWFFGQKTPVGQLKITLRGHKSQHQRTIPSLSHVRVKTIRKLESHKRMGGGWKSKVLIYIKNGFEYTVNLVKVKVTLSGQKNTFGTSVLIELEEFYSVRTRRQVNFHKRKNNRKLREGFKGSLFEKKTILGFVIVYRIQTFHIWFNSQWRSQE